jgi:hypothetical protein
MRSAVRENNIYRWGAGIVNALREVEAGIRLCSIDEAWASVGAL